MILRGERKISRCRQSVCSKNSQKQQKRRFLENRCCVQVRRLEQIIAKRIADAANRNGATGVSDIDGSAAQGSGSESGEERINLWRNVAILCASWKNGACREAAT